MAPPADWIVLGWVGPKFSVFSGLGWDGLGWVAFSIKCDGLRWVGSDENVLINIFLKITFLSLIIAGVQKRRGNIGVTVDAV